MIHELRTYTLGPGKQAEYLRLQKEIGRPVRGDRFGTFRGGWMSEFGVLNQYYHLWEYEDAGARQRLRAGLAKDPRWIGEYLSQTRELVLAQENMILYPVEGVPFTPPGGDRHIYELRKYRTRYQMAPEWLRHFREILPARQEYSSPVGMWTTDVGSLNLIVHLWAYDDLNHRRDVRARVVQDPRWTEYLAKTYPLLLEQQSVVLIPTESSPLQ